MANLLQKASIVLTPTAYNNSRVMCVKPSDGSGDFVFSRNSAATRVNAKGLVKNVQILSSNLVQNGDFSEEGVQEVSNGSFSQEGVEQITNGSFSTDSDWSLGSGITISGGSANFTGVANANINQNAGLTTGKTYKIVFTVSNYVSGDIDYNIGGATRRGAISGDGTYTDYVVSSTGQLLYFQSDQTLGFTGSIDNVSVREVGQDWSLGTGWSIGEDKAASDGTQTSSSDLTQALSTPSGKSYKITYTISEYTSGSIFVRLNSGNTTTSQSSVGTFTEYLSGGNGTQISLRANADFIGSITNISVKEVGQNWVIRNAWSIEAQGVRGVNAGTQTDFYQLSVLPNIGKSYKYSFQILEITSGSIKLDFNNAETSQTYNTIGVHTGILNSTGGNGAITFRGVSSFSGLISNISVIEITDDTNLPRINYEGFSYQDALGSELYDGNINQAVNGGTWIDNGDGTFTVTGVGSPSIGVGVRDFNAEYLTIGKNYLITAVGNNLTIAIYDSSFGVVVSGTSPLYFTPTTTTTKIYLSPTDGITATYSNVSVKEYLGQEVVPDSGCGSWLFEPQSTNLIPYSEDFSQWSKTFTDVDANEVVSPDGTLNASKITATSTSQPRVEQSFSAPSVDTKNTFSVFVKKGNTSYIALSRFSGSQSAIFDLDTISIVSQSSENATIKEMGKGWFKISITQTVLSTDTYNIWKINLTNGISTNVGVVGEYVYTWGAQLEQQSYATSYIPTEGSTVTRNQDACIDGGSLATINSSEGVLYAEITAFANDGTLRSIAITDGTVNNIIVIRYWATGGGAAILQGIYVDGGATYVNDILFPNLTDFAKIALSYKQGSLNLYVNGTLERSIALVVNDAINWNTLQFDIGNGTQPFYGKVKAVAVWKEALSDAELIKLTTI